LTLQPLTGVDAERFLRRPGRISPRAQTHLVDEDELNAKEAVFTNQTIEKISFLTSNAVLYIHKLVGGVAKLITSEIKFSRRRSLPSKSSLLIG
jgi:hypothetical protein